MNKINNNPSFGSIDMQLMRQVQAGVKIIYTAKQTFSSAEEDREAGCERNDKSLPPDESSLWLHTVV